MKISLLTLCIWCFCNVINAKDFIHFTFGNGLNNEVTNAFSNKRSVQKGSGAMLPSLSQKHAPLSFIENKGQVTDQNNKPRSDIHFKIAGAPGLNIFIGDGAIHYTN